MVEQYFPPSGTPEFPTKWYHRSISRACFQILYTDDTWHHWAERWLKPQGVVGNWNMGWPSRCVLPSESPQARLLALYHSNAYWLVGAAAESSSGESDSGQSEENSASLVSINCSLSPACVLKVRPFHAD